MVRLGAIASSWQITYPIALSLTHAVFFQT